MSEIAKLFVSINADMDNFKKGMGDVQSSLQNASKKFGDTGKSMTKNVTAPILAAAGGALVLANKWAATGDNIAKTAPKLGISTDALQEMDYWASQNGISAGEMERGVGRLNQRLGMAKAGNEKYQKALQGVGVNLDDVMNGTVSTEDAMKTAIRTLSEMESEQEQSAAAAELFGTKLARDLMPALKDGSLSMEEAAKIAQEMGIVMDGDALKAAENYQDGMDDLKRQFGSVWMELANKLIPIIVDTLIPAIQDHVIPLIRSLVEGIANLISWFQNLDPRWQKVIGIAIGFATALGPILIVIGKVIGIIKVLIPIILAIASPIGIVVLAVVGLIAIWVKWGDDIKRIAKSVVDFIKKVFADVVSAITNPFETAFSKAKGTIGKLTDTIGNLNPFKRRSPSLVDNVKSGVAEIENLYSGINIDIGGNVAGTNTIDHTGTIRIEGVNNQGEFMGAVDVAVDKLARHISDGDRRIPNRVSIIPIG